MISSGNWLKVDRKNSDVENLIFLLKKFHMVVEKIFKKERILTVLRFYDQKFSSPQNKIEYARVLFSLIDRSLIEREKLAQFDSLIDF
ncbi:hypothetical protein BpHYR1_004362 [Brachionus plicatilis]|uniref:Uncharacterized protein n=1 Tax=Brachionus plicatilis TaxID=10195 RepID=A0A3M7QKF3_BRAPC|nr:hypothetical protein BpHYR1_004362 [Brachionus plicatilis]